ncbi:MAG: carbamoyltransferase HypF, partial [Gemmataceae bacterium]
WRFHEAVLDWAAAVAARHPSLPVVLGGGCFHNGRLVEGLLGRLAGREAYFPAALPAGDGGLAAGQLAVAIGRLRQRGV